MHMSRLFLFSFSHCRRRYTLSFPVEEEKSKKAKKHNYFLDKTTELTGRGNVNEEKI